MMKRSGGAFGAVLAAAMAAALAGCGSSGDGGSPMQFSPPILSDHGANGFPLSLAFGDFDGDGKLDVVVLWQEAKLRIMRGNGDGSFGPPREIDGISDPRDAAVADLDGDGRPDLVVTGCDVWGCYPQRLFTMRGRGDGTFDPPLSWSDVSREGLAVADFNGDGRPDVAMGFESFSEGVGASVLLGGGDGTLAPPTNWPLPSALGTISRIVATDLQPDGKQDLVLFTSGLYLSRVSALIGHGDGTFEPVPPQDLFVAGICLADFNIDGRPDVIGVEHSGKTTGPLLIRLGIGDGTFGPPVYPESPGVSLVVGDANGDRTPDLVSNSGYGREEGISIAYGNGDATFQPATTIPLGYSMLARSLIDVNADGRLDLVLVGSQALAVMLNTG